MSYSLEVRPQTPDEVLDNRPAPSSMLSAAYEDADLVVVGAGLSGLAAAYFYQRRLGPDARIVVLEAAAHVGGMTRRVEFDVEGHKVVTNGGAVAFEGMRTWTTPVVRAMLRDLGVLTSDAADRSGQGIAAADPHAVSSRAIYIDAAPQDVALVTGDILFQPASGLDHDEVRTVIGNLALAEANRKALADLWLNEHVPSPCLTARDLSRMSYRELLVHAGLSAEANSFMNRRTIGTFGSPSGCVPALDALRFGLPGQAYAAAADLAPYTWPGDTGPVFPDGLATVTRRLLERIKTVADEGGGSVQVRTGHRVISLRSGASDVVVDGLSEGVLRRLNAKHAVYAGPARQLAVLTHDVNPQVRASWESVVKPPMCYASVAIRNWHAFAQLGISDVWSPDAFFYDLALRRRPGSSPDEPAALELVYRPVPDANIRDFRAEARLSSAAVRATTEIEFRNQINSQLDRILGPAGFRSDRDIAAVVVNVWPNTYSPVVNTLVDDIDAFTVDMVNARQPIGALTIAGADSHRFGWAQAAVDAAERAVNELPVNRPQAAFN